MDILWRGLSLLNFLPGSKCPERIGIPAIKPIFEKDPVTRSDFNQHYREIDLLKRELLKDTTWILVTDLGAGSASLHKSEKRISDIARVSSHSKKNLELQYRMIRHFKPQIILELGTSLGFSSALFARAAPDSLVITVEGCHATAEIAQRNFTRLGLSNVRLITGNFDKELDGIFEKYGFVDYLFVDGNHRYKPTLNYFMKSLSYTRNRSIFVFDDIRWSKPMENAWREILTHPAITLGVDLYSAGIVMFDKELPVRKLKVLY